MHNKYSIFPRYFRSDCNDIAKEYQLLQEMKYFGLPYISTNPMS